MRLAAAPRRAAAAGRASSIGATALRLLVAVGIVVFVFLAGVIVGVQFFDVHRVAGDAARPWTSLVSMRGPLLRGGVALPAPPAAAPPVDAAAPPAAAPDAVDATVPALPPPAPPSVWGVFDGSASVRFDVPGDAAEVSVSAWIYVDSAQSVAIKTIVSTRAGGCAVDAIHRGYSFFVNNWESGDRALVVEWRNSGGSGDGCGRLTSDPGTVPLDTWVHVGFALAKPPLGGGEGAAMLFLNGELLKTGPSSRRRADVQRRARGGEPTEPLTIGATADGQYRFKGRIAHVLVSAAVLAPRTLGALYRATGPDAWVAAVGDVEGTTLAAALLTSSPAAGLLDVRLPEGVEPAAVAPSTAPGVFVTEVTGLAAVVGVVASAAGGGAGLVRPPPAAVGAPRAPPAQPPAQPPAAGGGARAPAGGAAVTLDEIPAAIRRAPLDGALPAGAFDFRGGGNQWVPRTVRVPAARAAGSVTDPAALAAGTFSDDVTLEQLAASDELGRTRAAAVKAAMAHAWKGYRERAWGSDEVKPRSGVGQDNWAGMGMTLVDSLDTLWIMGMKDEFAAARDWVASSLSFDKPASVSVFETTIRALGGLLSAYDLSGDPVFLDKAKDLGNRLLPAFNTPSGIPRASIVLSTGAANNPGWTGGSSILAELGTLQVEFRYLGAATHEPAFARKAEAVIERMDALHPADGLYPIYVSADSGQPSTSHVTFGALGDSFYEYLLKVWLQGGRAEPMYRRMYDAAMAGMEGKLLQHSRPSGLAYVADWNGANVEHKMDHLVCFVPGMLALGAFSSAGTPGEARAVDDLVAAKALAYTCWQMYERTATGIAAEFVDFPGGADLVPGDRAPFYILRPEAAESLFVLHQLTGNPIYREWGWRMFSAIDKYCKLQYGYGAHPDVRDPSRTPDDRMESFFLAETLKYLYMLQSPDHEISLARYVFNTEAHPLRRLARFSADAA